MCQFKSGIILKNKVVLAPEGNESHSDLLESLGIEDTHMNATKTFVRAELIPKDDNKHTNINEWKYRVDRISCQTGMKKTQNDMSRSLEIQLKNI